MVSPDLYVFLLIGFLGGAHCIGMCGPLVTIYGDRLSQRSSAQSGTLTLHQVRQHSLFNLGRTLGYASIGAVMGFLGGVLFFTTGTITQYANILRGSVGILVGVFVISVGAYYTIGRTGTHVGYLPSLGFSRITALLTSRVDSWVGGFGILGLGAIHGLLPCPILYPAFLYAFATGSAIHGFLALATLGIGTIPAVFFYGTIIDSVNPTRRHQLHRVLGVLFLVLGYIPLSHGLMAFGIPLPHVEIPIYQPLEGLTHGHSH